MFYYYSGIISGYCLNQSYRNQVCEVLIKPYIMLVKQNQEHWTALFMPEEGTVISFCYPGLFIWLPHRCFCVSYCVQLWERVCRSFIRWFFFFFFCYCFCYLSVYYNWLSLIREITLKFLSIWIMTVTGKH